MSREDCSSKDRHSPALHAAKQPPVRAASEIGNAAFSTRRILLVLVALLIAYGSLYPFRLATPASLPGALSALMDGPALWTSRGDVVGNILLFLPLGLLANSGPERTEVRHHTRLGLRLFACIGFALCLQVAQVFFPPRQPALSDVLWNAVGSALGLMVGSKLEVAGSGIVKTALPRSARLIVLLLCSWGLTQLAPFMPALDWQQIKLSLRPLLHEPELDLVQTLYAGARVLAVGLLWTALGEEIARSGCPSPTRQNMPRRAVPSLALLLGSLLLAKLLIVGQRLSLPQVMGYSVGFLGWWLLLPLKRSRQYAVAIALLWVAYTVAALHPLQFSSEASPLRLLPFESLLQGSMTVNMLALLESLFVFGTLLWLAQRLGASLLGVSVGLCLWVAMLELVQLWIPARTGGDITVPLLVLIAASAVRCSLPNRSSLIRVGRSLEG